MGLPAEFVQLATDKVARINDAYDRICQHRSARRDVAPKWYHGAEAPFFRQSAGRS
jgi:hypothetical protein